MTSKVEEVEWRKNELLALCCTTDVALNEIRKEHLDSLISAAHAEGVEEGADEFEKKRADEFNKLIDDHDTAFASGVAEGAEQERERIMSKSLLVRYPYEDDGMLRPFNVWIVPRKELESPASVLAPTKPERGKPSQALLDELSEICGEKVEYEPKAQP